MSDNTFPSGFVAKADPFNADERYVFGDPDVSEYVQVKLHEAHWFQNNPRDDFPHPDQKVVLNSMENDKYLLGRTPEEEVEIIRPLEDVANVVFAGDRMTYPQMSTRELLKEIRRSVEGQKAFYKMMSDVDIAVGATIVGWEDWMYEHSLELLDLLDTRYVAFDATSYNSKYTLGEHIDTLNDVIDPDGIYLNGCFSEETLREMPREVEAFSGKITPLSESERADGTHSRELMKQSVQERTPAINNWQAKISEFGYGHATGDD
ncbi:hypothetical protein NP511_17905 [Natrinema thermotolerans]|uniref:Uncharacterized protein n=1 Tax=Natrinema thermotolerans TaxID=121872 RepID=A0AAF0PDP9_9EURY|nr:hypothetical protein [Natrinema thermotolerans]QCC60232.1 hypothetical protein DVR14_16980 [Natrinema thermotolerans]QCC61143.1 hypothetical protein DVR14_21105 [Natrinema thermotolerans]WMT07250.1 hypothetical protein NP511_17905 [Natrinema thermotolerans]